MTLSLPETQDIPKGAKTAVTPPPPAIANMDFASVEERVLSHTRGVEVVHKRPGFKHQEHRVNGARPVSFEEACSKYVHRFTMDHVPAWASKPVARSGGKYPGPHYATDLEWYKNTEFPDRGGRERYCRSLRQTYPLGKWLDKPFSEMRIGGDLAKVLAVGETQRDPDPRAVKRAEGRRKKRLEQFEITAINPVLQAIREHQPEPKKTKVVPTVAEMLDRDVNGRGKRPARGKTKKQRKPGKTRR